ncbi:50S ribosomal protein L18 [Nitrosophilus alvini]|uniref:50S ribosomal protein L18 n=1 Tax=Nitrosophilus alvini TaxID=2714855 RepID=UPI00190B62E4|nr:50S ribosomal protein L18 [Nitrosophilus alvini]
MRETLQRKKNQLRIKRKRRVRGKIRGTETLPRVTVFKSNRHFYAQAIDDDKSHTIAYADGSKMGLRANKEDVKKVAAALAEQLKAKGIETIVFDRNGYLYHGVVASFADALRENGIKF